MQNVNCPGCGQEMAEGIACPHCAGSVRNGVVPPAEVRSWAVEKTPQDLLAWARQTFDEKEFLAGVRENEQTGGVQFEELIGEIEERAKRRE